MTDHLSEYVLSSLNMALVQVFDDQSFTFIGELPAWIFRFYPGAESGRRINELYQDSPFLSNFYYEACEHWQEGKGGHHKSGPWIEMDDKGTEYALECSAFCIDGKKLLLIRTLDEEYTKQLVILQKAREDTLLRRTLEELVRQRTKDIRSREEEIALRLVWATEYRDNETGAHIRRIGLSSEILAKNLGWNPKDTHEIRIAAPMHDIGKIGIPDYILLKPTSLTSEEFEIMKSHTVIGAKILDKSEIPLLQMARDIAYFHHEKWDGAGYPSGKKGEEIPLCARIVAVTDVYDAMVNARVYRPAIEEHVVLREMRKERGKHFDPIVLDCFMDLLPDVRLIQEEHRMI